MNNPFVYTPDTECEEAFRKLIVRLEALKKSDNPDDINFLRELEAGKMLGVLIATDACGERHELYAFSGQLGDGGFHYAGFVGPVFDYLRPEGYFKTKETEISRQNIEISLFEKGPLARMISDCANAKEKIEARISEYREKCRLSKIARDTKRKNGIVDEEEMAAMIRQSQFEKAELHRLKKRGEASLEPYVSDLMQARSRLDAMKEKRRSDSESLQKWLFSNFRLLNASGESKSLSEIFAETPMRIPPSGAGECCAPNCFRLHICEDGNLWPWRNIGMASRKRERCVYMASIIPHVAASACRCSAGCFMACVWNLLLMMTAVQTLPRMLPGLYMKINGFVLSTSHPECSRCPGRVLPFRCSSGFRKNMDPIGL